MLAAGHKELVVTGVCLGSFGQDRREHNALARVMERLADLPGDFRLRLSSIEPWGITPRLIAALQRSPRWCPHLHIPFQSGSDAVLRRMRRPGSWAWYQRLVAQLRRAIPRISLSGDLIVGFPGERDDDFQHTLRLVEIFELMRVHWFPFSPREGTAAATLGGQLPPAMVQARMHEARAASRATLNRLAQAQVGGVAVVLVEADGGYTERYYPVQLAPATAPTNTFVSVTLQAWDGEIFVGTPVTHDSFVGPDNIRLTASHAGQTGYR